MPPGDTASVQRRCVVTAWSRPAGQNHAPVGTFERPKHPALATRCNTTVTAMSASLLSKAYRRRRSSCKCCICRCKKKSIRVVPLGLVSAAASPALRLASGLTLTCWAVSSVAYVGQSALWPALVCEFIFCLASSDGASRVRGLVLVDHREAWLKTGYVVRAFIGLALAIVTSPVVLDGQCEDDGWKAWHRICIELTEPALGERTLTLAVTGRPSQAQTFGMAAFYYLPASICLQVNQSAPADLCRLQLCSGARGSTARTSWSARRQRSRRAHPQAAARTKRIGP